MQRTSKFITYAIIAAFILLFSLFMGGGVPVANAATSSYTNALSDLKKDETFNADEYPERVRDYSINVINVAESVNGELFIYTYQPSGQKLDLKASSINISREEDNNLDEMSFANYPLTFLNSNGVFYKYKIDDFTLENADVRHYNISNILRPFNNKIDQQTSPDKITEVPTTVGKLWTARTVDGVVEYAMTYTEVVTITKKYVGYLQYFDGINFDTGSLVNPTVRASRTLRHFVAFSTDHDIDRLIEVEIEYSLQEYDFELCANIGHTLTDEKHNFKDIVYALPRLDENNERVPVEKVHDVIEGKKEGNKPHGWWGKQYSWDTIQTTSDFLEENNNYNLTTTGVNSIEGTQWVLSFYKQSVDMVSRGNVATSNKHYIGEYNNVKDVIILRLMFEKDGQTYNLGVVDDKRNSDPNPLNPRPISPISPLLPTDGSGCSGTGCNGTWLGLPWWGWLLIFTLGPLALILLYVTVYLIIKSICSRSRERRIAEEAAATVVSTKKKRRKRK